MINQKILNYRAVVAAISAGLILWGCLVVLKPFIPALILSIILCLSTWPAFEWLQKRLHNRHTLSSLLMTLLLALCFILPLVFLGSSLADNLTKLFRIILDTLQNGNNAAPAWMSGIPLAGPYLADFWREHIEDAEQLNLTMAAYAGPVSQWMLKVGSTVGKGIIDVTLGVLISYFFFRHGVQITARLRAIMDKFVGPRGRRLLNVTSETVIGVVYGLLGTALVQGALAGFGFWIAGVPGAAFLGFVTFLLSFIPVGPPLIWGPAAFWLFSQGETGMAVFMGLWGLLAVSSVDNVVRPYFISLGCKLPFVLVLLGVFGGIMAFGFIGLFIGPALLAVALNLIIEGSQMEDILITESSPPPEPPSSSIIIT